MVVHVVHTHTHTLRAIGSKAKGRRDEITKRERDGDPRGSDGSTKHERHENIIASKTLNCAIIFTV